VEAHASRSASPSNRGPVIPGKYAIDFRLDDTGKRTLAYTRNGSGSAMPALGRPSAKSVASGHLSKKKSHRSYPSRSFCERFGQLLQPRRERDTGLKPPVSYAELAASFGFLEQVEERSPGPDRSDSG